VAANIPALDPPAAGRVEYHGGNYEAALAHFRGRLEQNPDDAESLSNAGQVLVRLGRPAEALPLLSRAAELDPARWAYRFNLARAEGLLGQWERAAEDYVAAEGLFPNDYATIFNRAQALHMLGREQDAAAQYRRAIELKPDDPTFYLALGMSEEKLGRRAEAAAAYRRFLSLSPSDPQSEKVEARAKALESPAPAAPPRSPTTLTASAIPGAD
jgi:tetratricopeptide (TPR) repeat protein